VAEQHARKIGGKEGELRMSNQPTMTNPQRALQVWSLLALAAMTRTILTYEEVANLTGLPNNSGNVLGHIYYYCAQHNLPVLTALVVDKHTGRPSAPALYDGLDISEEHRRCFGHDWLKQGVPSLQEFQDAYEAGKAAAAA
jgi:hypothetical protein